MTSAALLDKVMERIITNGVLTIVHADGREHSIGKPAPGFPDVRVRFADHKVARQLVLDPRLGAGEAYMDGRLLIEQGDIMQLACLLRANKPYERGVSLHRKECSADFWTEPQLHAIQ